MTGEIAIRSLEDLFPYLNDKGILEIAIRGKKKRFHTFQKIILEKAQQGETKEKVQNAIALLNKNNNLAEKNFNMLGDIAKINKFGLLFNGVNLCATCAGFAIMYIKLDKIESQIAEVIATFKKAQGIQADFEFKKILSEHSDMLDCRKKQKYYSEEEMRKLVDGEYNVLDLLINIFLSDTANNQENLVFSILSLASMLSVSLKYFDEEYYYNNKESIGDGDVWHSSHEMWISIFSKLSSSAFIDKIQDTGIFEIGLNTEENDIFYKSYYEQICNLKEDIEDNQTMIAAINDPEIFNSVMKTTTEEIRNEITAVFSDIGLDSEVYEDALKVAVV